MIFPQMLLDLNEELIVDLFAGGGGASLGIEMATGRQVDVAVNHDRSAVELHKANHPQTEHFHADVFEVDPREVTRGRPVGLLWASPDCTYHSKARGAKPIRHKNRKRRALAEVVVRWAAQVQPRVIHLENVEEFANWGPLHAKRDLQTGRVLRWDGSIAAAGERVPVADQQLVPCPRRAGRFFRRWKRQLESLGYVVEMRELRACDYGAPTIRKRLFVIARCDGRPIVWPEPTHGPGLKPFRTAAECIDWSVPMLSIFASRAEAREWAATLDVPTPVRPLAEATMRRVARGVMRYVVNCAKPFIVKFRSGAVGHEIDEPLHTITANSYQKRPGGAAPLGLAVPIIAGVGGRAGQSPERTGEAPLGTITSKADAALAAPIIVPVQNASGTNAQGGDEPLRTITAKPDGGGFALAAPIIVPRYGERDGQEPRVRSAEDPYPVVVPTGNGGSLAAVQLATYYGEKREGDARGAALDGPLHTQTTENRHALVASFMARHWGGMVGKDLEEPHPTILTKGAQDQIVTAQLTHFYTSNTAGGQSDPDAPLPTQTTANHAALIYAFMQKYYGTDQDPRLDEALHTITTKDRFSLVTVTVAGALYVIIDICMRMLQPRELYNAQGFDRGYIIDRGADGRRLTKTEQVRMVGNSVCPPLAAALVRANLPELRVRDEAAA